MALCQLIHWLIHLCTTSQCSLLRWLEVHSPKPPPSLVYIWCASCQNPAAIILQIAITVLIHFISLHTYASTLLSKQNKYFKISYTNVFPVLLYRWAASSSLNSLNGHSSKNCSWNDKMKINKVVRITECLSCAQGKYHS